MDSERKKAKIVRETSDAFISRSQVVRDVIMDTIEQWIKAAYEYRPNEDSIKIGNIELTFGLPNTVVLDDFLIQQLRAIIFDALQNSGGFESELARFLLATTQMEDINVGIQARLSEIDVDTSKFNQLRTSFVERVVSAFNPSNTATFVSQNILPVLTKSLLMGKSMRDTQQAIEERIGSSLRRIAVLYTRDGLYGYDGAVNDVIRKEYNMNAFRYVGSLVRASRTHCKRWVETQILTKDYLEKEIAALHMAGDPEGFKPETNWDNFAQHRGGWNCRHQAIPVRVDSKNINSPI